MSAMERSTEANAGTTGAYASGLDLYYEIHGTGKPLILLHGGLGSIGMFGEALTQLSAGRQVIGVDLQAHGRTADVDRPLRFESMADDIAALIKHLGLDKADIMGYSLGGGVALRTVIQHPELIRKAVLVSTPFARNGWHSENLAGMNQMGAQLADMMKQGPIYELYASIAPRPEDWPVLLDKTGELLRRDYDWSKEVATIKTPTMIAVADYDAVRITHAAEFFQLLGGGKHDAGWDGSGMSSARLAVLPGTTHYNIFSSPLLVPCVTPFLDAA